mmetsp:Transcript_22421/g.44418  ORF Transcript_22421/g.44418 Transcript_22421/m.44418 type:complete len:201 (-) Transcript_22421:288-890(-)
MHPSHVKFFRFMLFFCKVLGVGPDLPVFFPFTTKCPPVNTPVDDRASKGRSGGRVYTSTPSGTHTRKRALPTPVTAKNPIPGMTISQLASFHDPLLPADEDNLVCSSSAIRPNGLFRNTALSNLLPTLLSAAFSVGDGSAASRGDIPLPHLSHRWASSGILISDGGPWSSLHLSMENGGVNSPALILFSKTSKALSVLAM